MHVWLCLYLGECSGVEKKKSLLLIWNKVCNLWHFMFSQQDLFIGKKVGGLYCEQWITYCYQLLKLWDIANCGRALKKLFKLQQGKHTFISALARGTHGKKKEGKKSMRKDERLFSIYLVRCRKIILILALMLLSHASVFRQVERLGLWRQ